MKKRTIYITLFLIFIIGVISLIGTFAIDSSITEGNSTKADYLFNITLGDRTNREITIPSYDSKIVDIKISNPNDFNMSYLLYLEGINSNLSIINISDTEASGVLNSKDNNLIKVFIQNNSSSDITTSIKDIVGFEKETLSLPSNSTAIAKGTYYKSIVKSSNKDYGKVKPNIKLSTKSGTVKYTLVPNTGYQYKSNTCNGTVSNNILTISNITNNVSCEVVFEPKNITVSFDLAGGVVETTYTEPKEHTYTVLYNGTYKLETWGAQGSGYLDMIGGYGGYSVGIIQLASEQKLYVNVGGSTGNSTGGYNGGGNGASSGWGDGTVDKYGGGGGATHIATKSGLLSTLGNYKDNILIVSGGGGGSFYHSETYKVVGGHAGGYIGNNGNIYKSSCATNEDNPATGGTQTTGGLGNNGDTSNKGTFGQGGTGTGLFTGGGGGLYGGGGTHNVGCTAEGAAGGSGYIGNSLLTNKYMYCYNCTTSDATSTKTYTTTNTSSTPISNYAKSGNGAAKITLVDNANYKVIYNTKYSNLPTPTRSGYTFMGWYTGENGTGTKVDENTILTNASNHTLYANWTKKNIMVTLDGNIFSTSNNSIKTSGLTFTYNPNTSYLTINGTATANPTLNFIYDMTFTEGEQYAIKTTYISGSCVNAGTGAGTIGVDIINSAGNGLSPRNKASHSITNKNGNTSFAVSSVGASEGNGFKYWIWFATPTDWTFTNYVIKVDVTKVENKIIQYGEKYGTLPTPTRIGYTFAGWYTGENGTGTRITNETIVSNDNNHTLYAKWAKKSVTVSYDLNYNISNVQSWLFANDFQSRFTNVYDSSTGTSTISCVGEPGWELVYFQIDTIANTKYEVTFDYEIPSKYNALSGYSGVGYQALTTISNSDNSSDSLATKYLPTSATTSVQKATLSFKATTTKTYFAFNFGMAEDGATTIKIKNVTVKYKNENIIVYGSKYGTLPASPTRTGYTFAGWYTRADGTGTKVTSTTTLTNENNHSLYAKWVQS